MTDGKTGQKLAGILMIAACMAVLAGTLIWFGFVLIRRVPDQLTSIVCFALVALILFHAMFWNLRKLMNEKSLKVIDYMYLGLALFGVLGIIDLQSKVYKGKVSVHSLLLFAGLAEG
jgi:hypothetical protein